MGTMTKAKKSTTKFVICEHDDTDTSVYTLSERRPGTSFVSMQQGLGRGPNRSYSGDSFSWAEVEFHGMYT